MLGQLDFRKKFVLESQSKDLVQIHKVQNIAIHPLYEPPPKPFHDIAILKIKSRNIEFTNFVKPICLPPPDGKLYTDDVAVALGNQNFEMPFDINMCCLYSNNQYTFQQILLKLYYIRLGK